MFSLWARMENCDTCAGDLQREGDQEERVYKTLSGSSARLCASQRWFLLGPESDIHLLPQTSEWSSTEEFVLSCQSRQFDASLKSLRSFGQSATDETWQAARGETLLIFFATVLRCGVVFSFYC